MFACEKWKLAASLGHFADHKVSHLCGAPVVMGMLINATDAQRQPFDQKIEMMTAASAPPAAVLQAMEELGIRVTHAYGLTEVYGPATVLRLARELGRIACR